MYFQAARAMTHRWKDRQPWRAFPYREGRMQKAVLDGSLRVLFRVDLSLCVELSRRLTGKLDAMGAVHDTITDSIGYGRIPYHLMPTAYRNLRDNDGGFSPDPLLKDLEQGETAGSIKRLKA